MAIVEVVENYGCFPAGIRLKLDNPSAFTRVEGSTASRDTDLVLVHNTHGYKKVPKCCLRIVGTDGQLRRLRRVYNASEKEYILSKSKGRCACCGKRLTEETMTIEHVVPISIGGDNNILNVVALCRDCNNFKSNVVMGSNYFKYLGNQHKYKLDCYIMMYRFFNSNFRHIQLLKSVREEIDVTTGFIYSVNGIFPVSVKRDLAFAQYSDLDGVYQFLLDEGHFRSAELCKEFVSDYFSSGAIYVLYNHNEISMAMFMGIDTNSVPAIEGVFFKRGVSNSSKSFALHSSLSRLMADMATHLDLVGVVADELLADGVLTRDFDVNSTVDSSIVIDSLIAKFKKSGKSLWELVTARFSYWCCCLDFKNQDKDLYDAFIDASGYGRLSHVDDKMYLYDAPQLKMSSGDIVKYIGFMFKLQQLVESSRYEVNASMFE